MKAPPAALIAAGLCGAFFAARGDDIAELDETKAPVAVDPWAGITQLFPSGAGFGEGCSPAPSPELVGEFDLPDSAPEGLSGIAWRGNTPGLELLWSDLYALVEDSGGRLHSATIGIDRETGAITNAVVSPAGAIHGAADLEGIACGACPVADGTVPMLFASDERGPAVWATAAFDTSGPDWTALPVPAPLRRCRPNLALEALALSADGRILWTANEGPLPEDGPEPTAKHGALVRLYGLPVCSFLPVPGFASSKQAPPALPAEPAFRFYELDPATGTSFPHLPAPFNGLAALCALPDGRLLALERSFGFRTRGDADPRGSLITISIYLVDPLHADRGETDDASGGRPTASSAARQSGRAVARPDCLAKTLLWRGLTGRANYEGMTLGPELADGSRALILVADGDVTRKGRFSFAWRKSLLSFRLRMP